MRMTIDQYEIGDEVDVFIEKLESKEGFTILSRKRAEYEVAWQNISKLAKSREVIDVKVCSVVQGGLVAEYNGIRGFIPASQVVKGSYEQLDQLLNQTLSVIVLKVDRRRKKVIFSNKSVKSKGMKEESLKLLESLEVGQIKQGKVTSIKDFGVFVDLGGIEGLVHISELAWSRVNHPSEIVQLGQEVNVFILGVDKETGKVSLGMKQLQPDPWVTVVEKYSVGQVITGVITRLVAFGAFIRIEDRLEGLIHISELANQHVEKVEDVVKVGDSVQAKIIKLIPEEQKIGLSLKGLSESSKPSNAEEAKEEKIYCCASHFRSVQ